MKQFIDEHLNQQNTITISSAYVEDPTGLGRIVRDSNNSFIENKEHKTEDLIPRIGTFLMLLGLFSFILFLASDLSSQTDFDWLFVGMLLMGIGYVLQRKAAPPPSAGRFSGINKLRERQKKRKAEKGKKQE